MKKGICANIQCQKEGDIYAKGLCPVCYRKQLSKKEKKERKPRSDKGTKVPKEDLDATRKKVFKDEQTFEPLSSESPQKDFCVSKKPNEVAAAVIEELKNPRTMEECCLLSATAILHRITVLCYQNKEDNALEVKILTEALAKLDEILKGKNNGKPESER